MRPLKDQKKSHDRTTSDTTIKC